MPVLLFRPHNVIIGFVLVAMVAAKDTSHGPLLIPPTASKVDEATDAMIAEERSKAKTAEFDKMIRTILGPSTTVRVDFVACSHQETEFGQEMHFLAWDMSHQAFENKDLSSSSPSSSYRFSICDPLDAMIFTFPENWGRLEFELNGITHKKGSKLIQSWTIPSYRDIYLDEFRKQTALKHLLRDDFTPEDSIGQKEAMKEFNLLEKQKQQDDPSSAVHLERTIQRASPSMVREGDYSTSNKMRPPKKKRKFPSMSEMFQGMVKYHEQIEESARERLVKLQAETPQFSFRQAVPGLFQEVHDTLGVLEADLERALEAIQALARHDIEFDPSL